MNREICLEDKYSEIWIKKYIVDTDNEEIVDSIVDEVILLIQFEDTFKNKEMVKQIILNSFKSFSCFGSEGAIICPRNANYWTTKNPYNASKFTSPFIDLLDECENLGLIDILTGNHNLIDEDTGESYSRTSIFFPTEYFIENYLIQLKDNNISISQELLPIYVHDKEVYYVQSKASSRAKKKTNTFPVAYPAYLKEKYNHNNLGFNCLFNSKKEEDFVKEYIKFINKFEFTLNDLPEEKQAGYEECRSENADLFANPQFRRIFNLYRGKKDKEYYFTRGGRWYGHWIQALYNKRLDDNGEKLKLRSYLLIAGKETVELDYSCLHANMLYAATNVTPMYEKDAYTIAKNPLLEEKDLRATCKLAMLIVFNAKNREEALGALRTGMGFKDNRKLTYRNKEQMNAILDGLMTLHEPIKKFFFSGIGVELQKIDSHIATNILKLLTKKEKPCIPIHDSFIVLKEDEELLRIVMLEEYQKTLKTNQIIGIG